MCCNPALPFEPEAFERRCRGCDRRGLRDSDFYLIGKGDRLERYCADCRRQVRVDRELAARTNPAKLAAMAASAARRAADQAEANRARYAARRAVNLDRVQCQHCPAPARHRHHTDGYGQSSQTTVIALCPRCHGAAHRAANRQQTRT